MRPVRLCGFTRNSLHFFAMAESAIGNTSPRDPVDPYDSTLKCNSTNYQRLPMPKLTTLIFAAALSAILFQACEIDHGLDLSPSKITGQVLFYGDPDSTVSIDEVRVVAASRFPPTGVADIFFSGAVNFGVDTADYEIILPYGDYPALAVLWKPRDADWALENLLGFYGFDPLTFQANLKGVQLTEGSPVAANVDIPALWGFTTFDGRVEGDLVFAGEWPENTEIVVLGAFTQVPDLNNIGLATLLFLGGINFTLPRDVAFQHYELPVRRRQNNLLAEYKFIGLFWKGHDIAWDEIRCIGFYRARNDSTQPGNFTMPPQGRVTGIDFVADFSSLPDGVKIGGGR